jgi:Domain of unknown function (DUF4365)/Chlororespiratory reduction 6
MSDGFPTYSDTAKKGEMGVSLVSQTVFNTFKWLFKRNHQEHDFGIDGQIEMMKENGAVTGQIIAAQIKYGDSYFSQKNRWGYIYRGETKHFNYLANYPIPVIICICEPKSQECYWVHFRPEQTEATDGGWKITVPFQNILARSKAALESLVFPTRDSMSELKAYWAFNKIVAGSVWLAYFLGPEDVKSLDVQRPRALFDRLRATKELAHENQGKFDFFFSGYDDDPRELFEIQEVKRYICLLDQALPDLFFFARSTGKMCTLLTFMLCRTDARCINERPTSENARKVEFDERKKGAFLEPHWQELNEMTDWLGMSDEENEAISRAVLRCLGLASERE